MTKEEYEAKAEELFALARSHPDPTIKFEYEKLAQSYLRLAQQVSQAPQMVSPQRKKKSWWG